MKIINSASELAEYFMENNSIYVYGAGVACHRLLRKIYSSSLHEIKGIVVTDNMNGPSTIGKYQVFDVKNTPFRDNDSVIIAVYSNCMSEIVNTLSQIQSKLNISILSDEYINKLGFELDDDFFARTPRTMLRFEVHLTEHCNLNCKGCSHFSPLAKPEFVNLDEYTRDIKRLSELFNGEVEYIHLMGGEPLLNPDIERIFDITREAFPVGHLQLVTNGILLLSMKESFWDSCEKNNIEIMPTQYPINVDYTKIREKAKKHHVFYKAYSGDIKEKTLYSFKLSKFGAERIEKNFYNCEMANYCINLSHGKLYPCVFPAYVHHLNQYFHTDFIVSPLDGIDIYSAVSGKEILYKLSKPIPFCRYCKVDMREYGIPYEVSRKNQDEWVSE